MLNLRTHFANDTSSNNVTHAHLLFFYSYLKLKRKCRRKQIFLKVRARRLFSQLKERRSTTKKVLNEPERYFVNHLYFLHYFFIFLHSAFVNVPNVNLKTYFLDVLSHLPFFFTRNKIFLFIVF